MNATRFGRIAPQEATVITITGGIQMRTMTRCVCTGCRRSWCEVCSGVREENNLFQCSSAVAGARTDTSGASAVAGARTETIGASAVSGTATSQRGRLCSAETSGASAVAGATTETSGAGVANSLLKNKSVMVPQSLVYDLENLESHHSAARDHAKCHKKHCFKLSTTHFIRHKLTKHCANYRSHSNGPSRSSEASQHVSDVQASRR